MGSAGYRVEQGRQRTLSRIVKGETGYILELVGHAKDYPDRDTAMRFPFKSKEDLTQEAQNSCAEEFESYMNKITGKKLFKVSVEDVSNELNGQ